MTRRDPWVNMLRDHARLLRRRGRRRRRDHRAAVRRGARAAGRLRPADRPQHPVDPARRVQPGPGPRRRPAAPGTSSRSPTQLAHAAWDGFTEIERAGGALAALDAGTDRRADRRDPATRRADDIAHRRAPLTGVSEFALAGRAGRVPAARAARPGGRSARAGPLRGRVRGAAGRGRGGRRRPGRLPRHARPGRRAHRPARLRRQPVPGRRHRTWSSARPRSRRSGTPVACLCSSDTLYAGRGGRPALRAAGARQVWLAGEGRADGVGRLRLRRLRRAGRAAHDRSTRWRCRDDPRLLERDAGRPTAGSRRPTSGTGLGDPGGHRGPAALHGRRPRRPRLPGHLPGHRAVPARPVPDDVRQPAVDDPPVRRVLHRRGVQRLLPAQPGGGAEGPVGRVRPGHPPRLRLRQPAGGRRRRHGRRGDRLDLRHAAAVRRHPARPDERVDDDERRGAAGPGALHRRRRGAGRQPGAARRDHPERHPQGVHGPQHLHLPAAAVDADHLRHLRVHLAADAEVQLDLDLRLPHPGGRGDRRPRARLHAGRRRRVPPRRASPPGWTSTRSRRGCRSSGRSA